jgi:hypothetical protein
MRSGAAAQRRAGAVLQQQGQQLQHHESCHSAAQPAMRPGQTKKKKKKSNRHRHNNKRTHNTHTLQTTKVRQSHTPSFLSHPQLQEIRLGKAKEHQRSKTSKRADSDVAPIKLFRRASRSVQDDLRNPKAMKQQHNHRPNKRNVDEQKNQPKPLISLKKKKTYLFGFLPTCRV